MIIGLAGGAGSGKSTVLKYLSDKYDAVPVIADDIAKEEMKKDTACFKELKKILPKEVYTKDGEIDRGKLGDIFFEDDALRIKVNSIVHERVKRSAKKIMCDSSKLYILESAILFSSGFDKLCDEVWFAFAPKKTRRERLRRDRNYSHKKIDDIFRAQSYDDKCKDKADFILNCGNSLTDTKRQIDMRLGR